MRLLGFLFLIFVMCAPPMCRAQPSSVADILAEGDKAANENRWEPALAAYHRAQSLAVQSGDATGEAAALVGLAKVEYEKSNFDTADQLAHQALAISQKLADQKGISAALNQISNVHYRRGEFKEALAIMQQLLAMRREAGDHRGIAVALNNMGNASRQLGDKLQAIDYLLESEKEWAALGNERNRAVTLNNIGIGYGELGDYERGLDYSGQSRAIAEKLKNDVCLGNALNNIGVIETARGNYRIALQVFQLAYEADQRVESTWAMAEVTNNIGLVYEAQRNYEQAIACYLKTIEINKKVGDKSLDADAYRNLANQMLSLDRLDEATNYYRQSLEICQHSNYREVEATVHSGFAMVYFRRHRVSDALAEYQKAADIQKEIADTPNLAGTYASLAGVQLSLGHAEEALRLARESAGIAADVQRVETLWEAQLAAGRALHSLHRDEEAAREFESSMATIESVRTRVAGPPTALPAFFSDKLEPYQERVALALAAGKTEDGLAFAEQSKSRALGDILRSGRVDLDKSLTAVERSSERRLQNRLVALNLKMAQEPTAGGPKTERDQVRRELDALQSQLYAAHPETAFQRGATPPLTSADIARVCDDLGAPILDYFVTPQETYVFVLKPHARPRVVALHVTQSVLAAKAAEFHRQVAAHDLSFSASSRELHGLLLGPVQKDLAGQSAIVIVPDGALWDVPFQALQTSPKHFLIEDTVVSYVPSLAVLRESIRLARVRKSTPAARDLLAFGDPPGPVPLPEAGRQLEEIEKLYGAGRSKIFTGSSATESALKAEASNYRILHVASHAILDDVNPMYSHAVLAQSTGEDGRLEARELMQLNLNAEILILSACETARGRAAAGEGINGMLWAAFVAGAPTTVASLWRVESASASDLMIGFHRHWQSARAAGSPLAKAASLRAAALELIAGGKYAHPFYWAAFVVVGSPN